MLKVLRRVLEMFLSQSKNVLVEPLVRRQLKGANVPDSTECVLYFADEPLNAYQVQQWYRPMLRLAEVHPVALMVRRPTTAKVLARDSPLPIVLATNMPEQEEFLSQHPVRIVFYVNNNKENFLTLRYPDPIHIHLSHGESDKVSMASNQLKAYDYAFIAGQASRKRILNSLKGIDERHLLEIGRPQLDAPDSVVPLHDDGRIVTLYAPTWEGERPAMAYGSVVSHGQTLVSALLADPAIRLIYRPHPRVGVGDTAQRRASRAIRAAIEAANKADSSAGHVIDDRADYRWSLSIADIAIVDVSAMAADWLATRKPMIITRPSNSDAYIDPDGLAAGLDLLPAGQADHIAKLVVDLIRTGTPIAQLEQVEHYFGDTTPGSSTERFLQAVDRVLSVRV